MSKSDEMDNLIVDLINKFDATYQKIMDELPIKLKDPFGKWPFGVQVTSVLVDIEAFLNGLRQNIYD